MAGGGGGGASLEYTPAWVVPLVCSVIIAISLSVEIILSSAGKYFLKKNQGFLSQALKKIKEELMLLGFISLLLSVSQDRISKICIPKHVANQWLPCNKENGDRKAAKSTAHLEAFSVLLPGSRRLSAAASDSAGYCDAKGKAPLLSLKALHDLHIFIFVLALSHVIFSVLTILFGKLQIYQWRHWEDSCQKKNYDLKDAEKHLNNYVQDNACTSCLKSFFKQFYGPVSESQYTVVRLGFVMHHCNADSRFNLYKYMTHAIEEDFIKVVGISWYLWVFVVLILLLNVYGWHTYFWISFVPLALLLAVGTELSRTLTQLVRDVAQEQIAAVSRRDKLVETKPLVYHAWFEKSRQLLKLIHLILFLNAFQLAVFFWMWVTFGFHSCVMGEVRFIISRLAIGVFVQFFSSYSTLPLYALGAKMQSLFKDAILECQIEALVSRRAQRQYIEKQKKAAAALSNCQVSLLPPTVQTTEIRVHFIEIAQIND